MPIFDINKDDLLRLSDVQLEELIARLAEAEVASHGHSPASVSWSGSINAADAGIDIQVQVPVDTLSTGFLERPDTVLQAKKHSMPKGDIKSEMVADGKLSGTISNQASEGGSYIIVSLADDCSPKMKTARLNAMQDALKNHPNKSSIHLDFYDRSKLTQWLRQHPSVMLWAKGKIGQGYSGWQPYGAWSNPPQGSDDALISAPGVTVTLPSEKGQKLSIEDAIEPMRGLVWSTAKAVRITGLSGVGKTRIVQALFDETLGTDPLDRTLAVYVDTGAEPDPSATAMLDRLITEDRRAIMILDNCPSELHSALASKVSSADGAVRLITVEYDIRDDKPQTTEVIHIEATGPEVAEQLVSRRFPSIGSNNARRISEFAAGNARVSLAIAERVEVGESLATLSDAQLFARLFEQRNGPDDGLREQAEILALVHSFSVSKDVDGNNELEILGSISNHSYAQLFRSTRMLLERHIMQKRGHWRAILPHAIANKLAASALDSIPVEQLRETFEAPGRQRLLMSFAHRLGLLHDHPVAKEVVEDWLRPGGLLEPILELDDVALKILNYIAPVSPDALLDRIEAELSASSFEGFDPAFSSRRKPIINLLLALAYEPSAFERCVRLLIRLADHEDESNRYDPVRDSITRLFQPFLSGTNASLGQRIAIMNECLASDIDERRALGFRMLSTALDGPPWMGTGINEFGARPRDYGLQLSRDELLEWRSTFLDVAVGLGTSGRSALEEPARLTLANEFRGLWGQKEMREKLADVSRQLHAHRPWGEGWKAIRSTIHFDHTMRKGSENFEALPESLAVLERELEPHDLVPVIMTYVLGNLHHFGLLDADMDHDDPNKYRDSEKRLTAKAFQLGEDFAASDHKLDELGAGLFSNEWAPYRTAFGRGLAKGGQDLRVSWQQLVEQLDQPRDANKNFSVVAGFIEEVDSFDPSLAQELLDQCAQHHELKSILVSLHPRREFTETDLDRCIELLNEADTRPWMYGPILWDDQYACLPESRVIDLAQCLLAEPSGADVVLDALSMKLHGKDGAVDTLGVKLRGLGLRAAIQRLAEDHRDVGGSADHHMECVISAALSFEGNEDEKREWLDTIFAVIDETYGYINAFESAIATTIALMPEEFLNRVFEGNAAIQTQRQFFIGHSGVDQSPLHKINVDVLIEWCRTRNDANVWGPVAAGICLWSKDGDQEEVTISESAISLLEASPNPETVLREFAEQVTPSTWSGSRAKVMQPRADAIGQLVEHECAEIAVAAKSIVAKLTEMIEREREREQREDCDREQRFE